MNFRISKNKKAGFTLIEALVFLFIFTVTVVTFYQSIASGIVAMQGAKAKIGAVKLANERMEIIRNIDYDNIGTPGGTPSGSILGEENVSRGNIAYSVHTAIEFMNDPFDNVPVDTKIDDYKEVRIRVFWENGNLDKSVFLKSVFIPPGIEEVHSGGILKIKVIDTQNQPIVGARVAVTNSDTGTNIADFTNADGYISLTNYDGSIQKYEVVVTKGGTPGYYSVHSYDPYPLSSFLPDEVHGTIIEGTYNEMSLVTDKLASFNIKTKDMLGIDIPNVEFSLTGGKKKGVEVVAAPAVPNDLYEYENNSLATDASGDKELNNMSYGPYFFTFEDPAADLEFIRVENSLTDKNRFDVSGTGQNFNILFANKALNSLLVKVVDQATQLPIANEDIQLKSTLLAYDKTIKTDDFGQAYFPDAGILTAGEYELSIKVIGYQDFLESALDISGDILVIKNVELIP